MTHDDHSRPGLAEQRAVAAAALADLSNDPEGAAIAALRAPCSVCAVIGALHLGYSLAAAVTGADFVTEPLRLRLLALVSHADQELRGAPN
jgi:hypothetical protein